MVGICQHALSDGRDHLLVLLGWAMVGWQVRRKRRMVDESLHDVGCHRIIVSLYPLSKLR